MEIDLLGKAFVFYGSIYTLCQECANFMKYSPKNISKNGLYCGCCLKNGQLLSNIECHFCKIIGNEKWLQIPVKDKKKENIYLCKSCHKPWIKTSKSVLELSTIMRGLKEKWKRLQNN